MRIVSNLFNMAKGKVLEGVFGKLVFILTVVNTSC